MLWGNSILLLVVAAVTTNAASCKIPAASCAALAGNSVSSISCASLITSSSTCTSTTTVPGPMITSVKTTTQITTVVAGSTSTRVIQQTFHDQTTTVTTTVTNTATALATTATPTTYYTTTTTTPISVITTTVTSTTTSSSPIKKLRFMRRAALPNDCSCFLTATYLATTTGKARTVVSTSTVTSTKTSTGVLKTTVTSTYYGTTKTSTVVSSITTTLTQTDTATISSTLLSTIVLTSTATSTIIETVVPSTTSAPITFPTPDTSCGNQGLQFAFNANPFYNGDSTYSSFDPQYFKTSPPEDGTPGVTTSVGFVNQDPSDPISIYGQPAIDTDYLTINHRGYLFARQSGVYTFSTPNSDDITLFWIRSFAYAGYDRNNANIVQPYGGNALTYSVSLSVGQYYPIRIMYGNGQEAASFAFTVTAPDGTIIISSDATTASPYLVQYSCDGTTAPQYPPFGAEV